MDSLEFQKALQEIENLPDTEGGGTSISRQERDERFEFCYARRDILTEMMIKVELSLKSVTGEIERLTQEERVELTEGPKPSFRRRATDDILGER
jgi:hypothetical protein